MKETTDIVSDAMAAVVVERLKVSISPSRILELGSTMREKVDGYMGETLDEHHDELPRGGRVSGYKDELYLFGK